MDDDGNIAKVKKEKNVLEESKTDGQMPPHTLSTAQQPELHIQTTNNPDDSRFL